MAEDPSSGWSADQWKAHGKKKEEEQWAEWLKKQEEAKEPRRRSRSGSKRRSRSRRKRSRRRKGKGGGKGKPAPDKLCGELWEEPREKLGLALIGEAAPPAAQWQYAFWDDSRRSYAGYLPCPFSQDWLTTCFNKIRDDTDWQQPEGRHGPIPRKTAWMVAAGCSCEYSYGGLDVPPQEYPPWMIALLKQAMPLCGITEATDWPTSCNVNLYEDGGMSVGWHSDDESLFQGKFTDIRIISLSLGVARNFEFRLNWPDGGEKPARRVLLRSGDLMTMEGMFQKHLQHRVPREENVEGPRINLTWRWTLKHKPSCPAGRRRAGEARSAGTGRGCRGQACAGHTQAEVVKNGIEDLPLVCSKPKAAPAQAEALSRSFSKAPPAGGAANGFSKAPPAGEAPGHGFSKAPPPGALGGGADAGREGRAEGRGKWVLPQRPVASVSAQG